MTLSATEWLYTVWTDHAAAAAGRTHRAEFRMLLVACWMLSVTCFTVPGRGGPLDVSAFDWIAVTKAGLRGTALLFTAWIILKLNFHPRAVPVLRRLLPFGLFSIWATLSFLWSPLKVVTLGHALEVITLVCLAISAGILVDSEQRRSELFLHLFLTLSLVTLLVLILEFHPIWNGERPSGFMHANSLGAISGSGLVLLLGSRFFFSSWIWPQLLLLPGAGVCSLGLFAARSRTSLLAGSIVLGALFFIMRRRALMIAVLAGGGLLLALMPYVKPVANIPQSIEKYVMRGQTREDLSEASGRQELWTRALESFRETPVLGHGYFMLSRSGTMYVWLKNQYQTAHNLYLHVLTGTGIVGALLFLWACMTAIGGPALSPQYFLTIVLAAWFALVGLFELSVLGPMDPSIVLFFATLGASVPLLETGAPQSMELNICEC